MPVFCFVFNHVLNDKTPEIKLAFTSVCVSAHVLSAGQNVCVKSVKGGFHFIPPTVRDVLVVLWPFVRLKLVEIIGPMRRLELQAE